MTASFFNHLSPDLSTSPTGSRNHLASFRFQNTFRLNVWNRNGDRWFSDPVGEVLDLQEKDIELKNYVENENGINFTSDYNYNGYYKSISGSYYSWHFWIYPLINLPLFSLFHFLEVNELRCFQITNSILLIASLITILFCFKNNKQKIIMASFSAFSPILLYVNWPHPEVFSYSFIIMAISFAIRKNYKISVLMSSIASLQNPPIAIFTFYLIFIGWK